MSPTTQKSAPGVVKVKSGLAIADANAATVRYWIGVLPSCPISNVHVGGICFPLFRGNPVFDELGKPDRPLSYGAYADLTDEQLEQVRHSVKVRVLRPMGRSPEPGIDVTDPPPTTKKRRATIVPIDGKKSKARRGDEPLARYLYMHRLDKMSASDANKFPPETMEE